MENRITVSMPKFSESFVYIFIILACALIGEPKAAATGTIGNYTFTLSGYVGSKKSCDKTGGGDGSCCGFGSPQKFASRDGKANGGNEVMLAVGDSMRKYMGCKVSVPGMGDNYRIMDHCPACDKLHRLDVSFKDDACGAASSFKKKSVEGIKILTDGCAKKERGKKPAKRKKKKKSR
jgi:hypothetical protein